MCLLTPNGYSCACTLGYKLLPDNKRCVPSEDIPPLDEINPLEFCNPNKCRNGGTCIVLSNFSWQCLCPKEWRGPHCEISFKLLQSHEETEEGKGWITFFVCCLVVALV